MPFPPPNVSLAPLADPSGPAAAQIPQGRKTLACHSLREAIACPGAGQAQLIVALGNDLDDVRERSMRVHAVQTGTVRVKSAHRAWRGPDALRGMAALLDRGYTEPLPVYAWVIEHPEGLIVVDTGASAAATDAAYFTCQTGRAHRLPWSGRPRFQVTADQEMGPGLRRLGLSPTDVRWVILTHLHPAHAGGLAHFPHAEVLVSRQEYEGQRRRPVGALPCRWPVGFTPRLLDYPHSTVWPFPGAYTLTQAADVHIIPTPGHSYGHQSVIVQTADVAYFIAGDTAFSEEQLRAKRPTGVLHDRGQARQTLQHILDYVELTPTVYLPSHDPDAPRRLAERRLVVDCGC